MFYVQESSDGCKFVLIYVGKDLGWSSFGVEWEDNSELRVCTSLLDSESSLHASQSGWVVETPVPSLTGVDVLTALIIKGSGVDTPSESWELPL